MSGYNLVFRPSRFRIPKAAFTIHIHSRQLLKEDFQADISEINVEFIHNSC